MYRLAIVWFCVISATTLAADPFAQPTASDVPQLVAALKEPNLRQGAVGALAKIGKPAVPALVEQLNSHDDDGVVWSAFALGKIGPAAASSAQRLSELLTGPDNGLRVVTARSLGQIGASDDVVVSRLVSALRDEDPLVRQHVASALGAIGAEAPEVCEALVAALADAAVRREAQKALVQLGEKAIPALKQSLRNDHVRLDVAAALREIDPAAAREAGVHQTSPADLTALAMALADGERHAASRIEFAGQLGQLGVEAAPALIAVFADPTVSVSRAAASAFRQIGSGALPMLRAALRHEDPQVRSSAADAIAAMGVTAQPAVEDLGEALQDPDRSVRYRVAVALDQLGPVADDAVPALIANMNDPREQEATRQMAIKALAQTSPAVRDTVIRALSEVNHQGNFGVRSLADDTRKQLQK